LTNTVIIELDVQDAQELAFTAGKQASRIDWVLENTPPKPSQIADLDLRAKRLTRATNIIKIALTERVLNNVVNLKA
jgi:hypothetical protein